MIAILKGLENPLLGPIYAFLAGVLSSTSPCSLGAMPVIASFLAAREAPGPREVLGFLGGMLVSLTAAGFIAGYLGRALLLVAPWIRTLAGLIFVVAGLNFAGILNLTIVRRGMVTRIPVLANPGRSALPVSFALGAAYAISASPCAAPALIAILTFAVGSGSIVSGIGLLFAYFLGQSLLVAAAGLAFTRLTVFLEDMGKKRWLSGLRLAGGAALIGFGIYLLVRPFL